MGRYTVCFVLVSIHLLVSWTNRDKLKTHIPVAKGEFSSDGLEKGYWAFYDANSGEMLEKGAFHLGVRNGAWQYYKPTYQIINWVPFKSSSGTLQTNFPDFLKEVESYDSLVVMSNKDTTKVFKVVIAI